MPGELSVLSYNTHLFGEGLVVPSYEDRRRAGAIARAIVDDGADLIGLSEVWSDELATLIRETAAGRYHAYRPPSSVGGLKAQGSGLLLLSRRRFVPGSCDFHPFRNLAGADELADKGVAQAALDLPLKGRSERLLVFLTHTQASYADASIEDARRYEWCRQQNLRTLANLVQNTRGQHPAAQVAVLGDLNVVAEDRDGRPTAEYRKTLGRLADLRDAFRVRRPSAQTDPGYTYDGETNGLIPVFAPEEASWRQRIDYHFLGGRSGRGARLEVEVVRRGFSFRAEDGRTMDLSDHYPLRSRLTLE